MNEIQPDLPVKVSLPVKVYQVSVKVWRSGDERSTAEVTYFYVEALDSSEAVRRVTAHERFSKNANVITVQPLTDCYMIWSNR